MDGGSINSVDSVSFSPKKGNNGSMRHRVVAFLSLFLLGFALVCPAFCATNALSGSTHSCCAPSSTPHGHACLSSDCHMDQDTLGGNPTALVHQVAWFPITALVLPQLQPTFSKCFDQNTSVDRPPEFLVYLKTIRIQC